MGHPAHLCDRRCEVLVANYEADAQLAKLDLVYSATQDSDFLVYNGMGEIMYDLRNDGSFKLIDLQCDVLGKVMGQFNFMHWTESIFRGRRCVAATTGDNPPNMGAVKLYTLITREPCGEQGDGCERIRRQPPCGVRSFQHHVVFEVAADGTVKQVHLQPLPTDVALSGYKSLTEPQSVGVYSGELDATTLGPHIVVQHRMSAFGSHTVSALPTAHAAPSQSQSTS